MKRLIAFVGCMGLMLITADLCSQPSEQQIAYDYITGQLQTALNQWCDGNPLAYADVYDQDLTFFSEASPVLLTGKNALQQHFGDLMGRTNSDRAFCKIANPNFRYFGNSAVLSFNLIYPGSTWQASELYVRSGNGWKIAHGHWSPAVNGESEDSYLNWKVLAAGFLILAVGFAGGYWSSRKKVA